MIDDVSNHDGPPPPATPTVSAPTRGRPSRRRPASWPRLSRPASCRRPSQPAPGLPPSRPTRSSRPAAATRLALATLLLGALLAGCGGAADTCDRTPPLTYDNFGQGFLEKNCTGCHSAYLTTLAERNNAPLGVDFNTYADVVHWWDRIDVRATVDKTMPPGGGLTDAELETVHDWLNCQVAADAAALADQEGG
jgi:hypothetical protein